jgi:hypothetical protein
MVVVIERALMIVAFSHWNDMLFISQIILKGIVILQGVLWSRNNLISKVGKPIEICLI